MKPAVILLSGGLDSTTTLAIAKNMGFSIFALTVLYNQRNRVELLSAQKVVNHLGAKEHKFIELDLGLFGGSALTDDIEVPHHQESDRIPNTYVPARNTILLSLALAYAEVRYAQDIFFGANIHDYSGYPDCRPAYLEAFLKMANLATRASVEGHALKIHTPLVNLTKAQIIKKGLALGVNYELTHSCYNPVNILACGQCSACFYRKKGFFEAGVHDPTRYVVSTTVGSLAISPN